MKRLALLFVSLVFSILPVGCGEQVVPPAGTPGTGAYTGPPTAGECEKTGRKCSRTWTRRQRRRRNGFIDRPQVKPQIPLEATGSKSRLASAWLRHVKILCLYGRFTSVMVLNHTSLDELKGSASRPKTQITVSVS